MNCGLVVVAAGRGERLGAACHKALVPLGGRPLLEHALQAFRDSGVVLDMVLVGHVDDLPALTSGPMGERLRAAGIRCVVPGGARRQDSVLAGLEALAPSVDAALIHDAARPFILASTIRRLAVALDQSPGVVPVAAVTSTVKRVAQDGSSVIETLPRADLRLAQTPQGGRRSQLIEALKAANAEGVEVTDDVQALERLGHAVAAVPDSRWNIKVTTPSDLVLAEIIHARGLWKEEE
ncbi:MAG: 2-C-methyl-D-erythritol 4-phosphate cytidylyltransferase [Planctomycetes bacterium]|nr:2-C-methyl-D-erythritol 4-phosphate cytidylyltransferase [Planctomycetota bacterium]